MIVPSAALAVLYWHNVHSRSHNVARMVVRFCKLANLSPSAYVADLRQYENRIGTGQEFRPPACPERWWALMSMQAGICRLLTTVCARPSPRI
jgi:hypothetical protein